MLRKDYLEMLNKLDEQLRHLQLMTQMRVQELQSHLRILKEVEILENIEIKSEEQLEFEFMRDEEKLFNEGNA